jgi:hypothetical protein
MAPSAPSLFVEYVGDFPLNGGASHLFNSGGGYRITPNQQIDFHIGFGLNQNRARLRVRHRLFVPARWFVPKLKCLCR